MWSYAQGAGRPLDGLAALATMAWSEPDRDIAVARKLVDGLLWADIELAYVWIGRQLKAGAFDVDHCLLWSAWPCGDFCNLLPSTAGVSRN